MSVPGLLSFFLGWMLFLRDPMLEISIPVLLKVEIEQAQLLCYKSISEKGQAGPRSEK